MDLLLKLCRLNMAAPLNPNSHVFLGHPVDEESCGNKFMIKDMYVVNYH